MDGGSWHCMGDRNQDYPQEKEMQKSKMAVWGGLTNSCEKKRSKKQRRKGKICSFDTLRTSSNERKCWWEVPPAPCPLVRQFCRALYEDFEGLQWDWAPVGQSGNCHGHTPLVSAHLSQFLTPWPWGGVKSHGIASRPTTCSQVLVSVPNSIFPQVAKNFVQICDHIQVSLPSGINVKVTGNSLSDSYIARFQLYLNSSCQMDLFLHRIVLERIFQTS